MMDIYTEHHPHHEIGPVEHLKYVGAQYYTTLLSRLTSHIKNEDVHVSNEDRYKWDNKADKTALRELEMKVAELTPSSSDKEDIDLSTYATHAWVDENYARKGQYPTYEELSSRYALKTDIPSVADFATRTYVDNAIAGINPGSDIDPSKYATQSLVLQLAQKDELLDLKINGLQDQVNSIDEYVLPTASDREKGGIKTGSTPGGTGDYPVLMDGEFAYVHVPISSTSEGAVITSMYSIHPIISDIKIASNGILQGSVTWSVSKHEGQTSSTVVFPSQEITTYAVLLPQNDRLEMLPFGRTGSEEVTAVCEWQDGDRTSGDFIQIFVKKDTTVVATSTIPVIKNGKDGTTTIEYQGLEFPVIRLAGDYNPNATYNNGTVNENGILYIDIVSYNGGLYKAIAAGANLAAPGVVSGQWEPFSIYGQAAFYNLLVANEAFIKSLAANQVVVVDNQGVPVAGLLSNDATITTEGGTYTRNGVRIFAGETNGDITTAPFRVYDDGSVTIENGSFTATNGEATAQLSLYGHPSNIQPHLYLENSVGQTAEMTALELIFRSAGNTTDVAASGIHTPRIEAAQGSFDTLTVKGITFDNGNESTSPGYTGVVNIYNTTFYINGGIITNVVVSEYE